MQAKKRAVLAGVVVLTGPLLVGQVAVAPADAVGHVAEKKGPGKKGDKPEKKTDEKRDGSGRKGDRDKPKPKVKKDRKPPATPLLGGPGVGPGGHVSLPVIAESGSSVVVAEEGGPTVATGSGFGAYSSLGWFASHGDHSYVVTAVDRAGNRSGPAQISVFVDATAPRLRAVRVQPGTPSDTRSRLRFTTDPGSAYRVLVDGRQVTSGRVARPRALALLDVADGRHRVELRVRDAIGNVRVASVRVRVRIPELAVSARFASDGTRRTQAVRLDVTPTARRGVVRLPGRKPVPFVLRNGSRTVELNVKDGTYDAGTVVVRDRWGRVGRTRLPSLTVDTSPPELAVVPDEKSAAEGSLEAAVTADAGATVRWRLVDSSGDTAASGEVVTEDGEGTLSEDVDRGSYRLVVTAADDFKRTTTVRAGVDVADDPFPAWLAVVFGVILTAGALLALAGLVLLVRRARLPESPVRRALAGVRDLTRRREKLLPEPVAPGEAAGAGAVVLEPAAAAVRVPHPRLPSRAGGELPDDSQVLHRTRVLLYETAEERDDGPVLGSRTGELVLARDRIAVVDERTGDVWSGRIAQLAHLHDDSTMVLPVGEDRWFGLMYGDPELTRPALDLVAAEQAERAERTLQSAQT